MIIKCIGAVLIVLGCGGFGFSVAANLKRELFDLRQLNSALEYMENEINYRMLPLNQLFRRTALISVGCIKDFFALLAVELERHTEINVETCVVATAQKCPNMSILVKEKLIELGSTFGMFDLVGQINSLRSAKATNQSLIDDLYAEYRMKIRSYKTLGLCAGASLIILFI